MGWLILPDRDTSLRPAAAAARITWVLCGLGVLCVTGWLMPGCTPDLPTGFDSLDPHERAEAIVRSAEAGDSSAVPKLIELLDSDDPGIRLLAIQALERMTGQRFGYDYAAPEAQRRESVARWVEWQKRRTGAAGSPNGGRP